MVTVQESTADELEEIAESQEADLEEVRETFKEKFNEVKEKSGNLPEDRIERIALRTTRTNTLSKNRIPSDEVELAVIGGSVRSWGNGEAFVGKALADTEDGEFLSTVIIDDDHVEMPEVYEAFEEVGNIVHGEFSITTPEFNEDFRILNSTEDTELGVIQLDPDERREVIEDIREEVPKTTIATIADNLSARESDDEGNLRPGAFGVDIRRLEGDIYDGYKNPDEGFGVYTVRDETMFDEEDLRESAVADPDANENAVPGLTCWVDPDRMEYGTESVCEFFGVVSEDDDSQVVMNVDGIVPIYATEFDGFEATGQQDEEEIDTGNVDRTNI